MLRLRDLAETLFYTDWFFLSLLVVLPVLSFVSIDYLSLRYSPELFFSALAAASIIVLAWERIAHSRGIQLRRLMRRVYLHGGETKLQQTLGSICFTVRQCESISDDDKRNLPYAIQILRRAGRFHGVDRLYPKNGLQELSVLLKWVNEYAKDLDDFIGAVKQIHGGKFHEYRYHVLRVMRGDAEMRFDGHEYHSYSKPGGEPRPAWPRFGQKDGEEFLALVDRLQKESKFFSGIKDSTWRREILQRASRIRNGFVSFLEKHGMEPPTGSDEDWIEGRRFVSYTGSIF